ncbi:MAG: hypothetical protein Q8P13_05455 [bacterium]|nr:hypothetical protein [bacterium]
MVRILALVWPLLASVLTSSLSFFYVNEAGTRHGFPFGFANDVVRDGVQTLNFSIWSFVFDLVFWWFLFSILLIVVKNYVFDAD